MGSSEAVWRTVAAGVRTVWWGSLLSIPVNLLGLLVTAQLATGSRAPTPAILVLVFVASIPPLALCLIGQWWCLAACDVRGGSPLGWSFGFAVVSAFALVGLAAFVFAGVALVPLAVWYWVAVLSAFGSYVLWLVFVFRLTHDLKARAAHDRFTCYRKRLVACVCATTAATVCESVTASRTGDSAVGLIVTAASAYSLYISWYYFSGLRAAAAAVEQYGRSGS